MCKNKFTIGIYGIQDINTSIVPVISHDHGICIMQSGKILYNAQLERLTRNKHCNSMPQLLYDLLKQKKVFNSDFDIVFVDNVSGRAFINLQGNIRFEANINNTLFDDVEKGRLWLFDRFTDGYILNHELAHIGSCLPFFGAFKDNSLLVHFDGGASLSNFSAWTYKSGKLENIEYGWDLKWLSALFNANALTFALINAKQTDINSVPGKFMGFASYGKHSNKIEKWLFENDFFKSIWGSKKVFFESVKENFGIELKGFDLKNEFLKNVAATIHHIFVRESFKKFKELQTQTKTENLYYSGGAALNIVLNNKIAESGIFKNIFIPPCCNDSGLALGAAAFWEWNKSKKTVIHLPFIDNWNIENYDIYYDSEIIKTVADLLIENKVVGICNGYGESGPRALGNRSIISVASSKKLAQRVSIELKQREWYRPVAPIMLEKNTKYFTEKSSINHLSKYMLLDFDIVENKQKEIEGVVHIDGTARIQTLFSRKDNPFMFDLLTHIDKNHGIKALVNTSFNIKGEPIVHTVEDAVKSAKNMGLDAVVLNGNLKLIL
jgi:carbamoyltransferase